MGVRDRFNDLKDRARDAGDDSTSSTDSDTTDSNSQTSTQEDATAAYREATDDSTDNDTPDEGTDAVSDSTESSGGDQSVNETEPQATDALEGETGGGSDSTQSSAGGQSVGETQREATDALEEETSQTNADSSSDSGVVDGAKQAARDAGQFVGRATGALGVEFGSSSENQQQDSSNPAPESGTRRAVNQDIQDDVNDPLILEDATRGDIGRIQQKARALNRANDAATNPNQSDRRDLGDRFVPDSVEDPANDVADGVEAAFSDSLEATGGVQSTVVVPTSQGLAAPGLGGNPSPVERGASDVVTDVTRVPATSIEVAETGAFAVGGTGLAGGSPQETQRRAAVVGEEAQGLAEQSAEFAQENPVRFASGVGFGVVSGAAASRVVSGPSTSIRTAGGNTLRSYAARAPDVDVDFTRTLRRSDRGQGDLTFNQDQKSQSEAEVQVERESEAAAEAEGSVEEFMEREPANANFREENINEGRGPSTPLAEERGLTDLTEEDFGAINNVERTTLDRESGDLQDRLPDADEFESQEAYEAELEILRERVASEAEADAELGTTQQVSGDLEQDLAGGVEGAGAKTTAAGAFAAQDSRLQTQDVEFADEGQAEAEVALQQPQDNGILAAPALEQQQNQAQASDLDADIASTIPALDQDVFEATDQQQDLQQTIGDQTQNQTQDTTLDTDLTTTLDTTQDLTQDLTQDSTVEQEVEIDTETGRRREDFDFDLGDDGDRRRREDVFGGDEQRFAYETLDF